MRNSRFMFVICPDEGLIKAILFQILLQVFSLVGLFP